MGNKHQRGRSNKWRRTHIGGIATEQLLQTQVAKLLLQTTPKRIERMDVTQMTWAPCRYATNQCGHIGSAPQHEGLMQCLKDSATALTEVLIAACLASSSKVPDSFGRQLHISVQVQPLIGTPCMASQDLQRLQGQFGIKRGSCRRKNLLENLTQGEYRGANVNTVTSHRLLPQFATRP